MDNAFNWYVETLSAGGAARSYVEHLASKRESWLPQIWLGEASLKEGHSAAAQNYFRLAASRVPPHSRDIAMSQVGHILLRYQQNKFLIELLGSRWTEADGLGAAGALVQAYIAKRDWMGAKRVIDQLEQAQKPIWARPIADLRSVLADAQRTT